MAVRGLQTELASRARLEDELSKISTVRRTGRRAGGQFEKLL